MKSLLNVVVEKQKILIKSIKKTWNWSKITFKIFNRIASITKFLAFCLFFCMRIRSFGAHIYIDHFTMSPSSLDVVDDPVALLKGAHHGQYLGPRQAQLLLTGTQEAQILHHIQGVGPVLRRHGGGQVRPQPLNARQRAQILLGHVVAPLVFHGRVLLRPTVSHGGQVMPGLGQVTQE